MMQDTEQTILADYVSMQAAEEEVGSVQELGFFALVRVGDKAEQADISGLQSDLSNPAEEWLEPGLYSYVEDSDGNIFTRRFPNDKDARDWWALVTATYDRFYAKETE